MTSLLYNTNPYDINPLIISYKHVLNNMDVYLSKERKEKPKH
jgi:hypothetical protein